MLFLTYDIRGHEDEKAPLFEDSFTSDAAPLVGSKDINR